MPNSGESARNRFATFPDTASARRNLSTLLRESTRLKYASVGQATGHDKSWVSRFLSGQGLISMTELLSWLDACQLELTTQEPPSSSPQSEIIALDRLDDAIRALQAEYPQHQSECCDQCECVIAALQVALVALEAIRTQRKN